MSPGLGARLAGSWGTLRSRLLEGWRWVASVVAIPAYFLAVWFWRQHAIDPLTAPALLLDRAFQVLTLALIPAGLMVLGARARVAVCSITFIGAVGSMLGVAILFSGLIRPPHDLRAVILAVVTILTGAGLVARYAPRIPEFRSVPARALAFGLASAIPLLQLWSNAAFLPSQTEATLSQSVDVKVDAVTDDDFRLTLNYKAANPTKARVIVTRLTLCSWAADEPPVFGDAELRKEHKSHCFFYRPIDSKSWISPASSVKGSKSYTIPLNRPRVTVVAKVAFARGDRLRTSDDVVEHSTLGECRNVEVVRLEAESRIKSLAEESKYLVYADLNADGGLYYYFDSGPGIECPSSGDPSNLADYFGRTNSRQVLDIWLTPPSTDGKGS